MKRFGFLMALCLAASFLAPTWAAWEIKPFVRGNDDRQGSEKT